MLICSGEEKDGFYDQAHFFARAAKIDKYAHWVKEDRNQGEQSANSPNEFKGAFLTRLAIFGFKPLLLVKRSTASE